VKQALASSTGQHPTAQTANKKNTSDHIYATDWRFFNCVASKALRNTVVRHVCHRSQSGPACVGLNLLTQPLRHACTWQLGTNGYFVADCFGVQLQLQLAVACTKCTSSGPHTTKASWSKVGHSSTQTHLAVGKATVSATQVCPNRCCPTQER
jgi:hypothetical protein